jgi:hypothetical protein
MLRGRGLDGSPYLLLEIEPFGSAFLHEIGRMDSPHPIGLTGFDMRSMSFRGKLLMTSAVERCMRALTANWTFAVRLVWSRLNLFAGADANLSLDRDVVISPVIVRRNGQSRSLCRQRPGVTFSRRPNTRVKWL